MGRKMSADPQWKKRIRHFYGFYMANNNRNKKRKRMEHDKKINKSRNEKGTMRVGHKKALESSKPYQFFRGLRS